MRKSPCGSCGHSSRGEHILSDAVQEPGAAQEVRRTTRQRRDLERDVRGVESRNGRKEIARTCEEETRQGAEESRQKALTRAGGQHAYLETWCRRGGRQRHDCRLYGRGTRAG